MNSIMYAQSRLSAVLLIFYACVFLPYRELKLAVSRILGSIFNQFCPTDTSLPQPQRSFKIATSTFGGNLRYGIRDLPKESKDCDGTQDHGDSCAICLEGFVEDDVVSELSRCGHVFHLHCIETWVEHRFQFTCPLCRSLIF